MSIVVIPCWQRPAHLAALLETIDRARGYRDHLYLFSVDRGYDPEILDVIKQWQKPRSAGREQPELLVTLRQHGYLNSTCNIMEAYRQALQLASERGDDYVIMFEEDLLVASDIFEFLDDAIRVKGDVEPSVSACRNQNHSPAFAWGEINESDAGAIYEHMSYQSLAVAHSLEFLELVCVHARPELYVDPTAYCLRELECAALPPHASANDGVFHRIILRENLRTIYPVIPRAFHAGWHGVNRYLGKPLPLPWRAAARTILRMPDGQMNELADPRFRDIARCDLARMATKLKLV